MGPPDKMKQSVTHYRFFFFSPPQPPPETLPENEVYFVAGNKNQCLTHFFCIPNRILALDKVGRPCTFPESRECFILYEANHFCFGKRTK